MRRAYTLVYTSVDKFLRLQICIHVLSTGVRRQESDAAMPRGRARRSVGMVRLNCTLLFLKFFCKNGFCVASSLFQPSPSLSHLNPLTHTHTTLCFTLTLALSPAHQLNLSRYFRTSLDHWAVVIGMVRANIELMVVTSGGMPRWMRESVRG